MNADEEANDKGGADTYETLSTRFAALTDTVLRSQYFAVLTAATGVIGILGTAVVSYREGNYFAGLVYGSIFLTFLLCAFGLSKVRGTRINQGPRYAFLRRKEFLGPGRPHEGYAWERIRKRDELFSAIEESDSGSRISDVIVIVGPSGAGKTFLFETEILPRYDKFGWIVRREESYLDFAHELEKQLQTELEGVSLKKRPFNFLDGWSDQYPDLLLILDQFERLIDYSGDSDRTSLQKFITSSVGRKNFHLVIGVRKDWYYDCVRLLEHEWGLVDGETKIRRVDLEEIDEEVEKEAFNEIRSRLNKVVGKDTGEAVIGQLARSSGRNGQKILPYEAQIVGFVLENIIAEKRFPGGEITKNHFEKDLGGKEGVINLFFDRSVKASRLKDTALALLYALSVHNRLHRAAKLDRLIWVTHHDPRRVGDCLSYFTDHHLVRPSRGGLHELSHDFLGEKLREFTARELSSGERDNILYFSESLPFEQDSVDFSIPPSEEKPKKQRVKFRWCDSMLIIFVILTLRLFSPVLDGTEWLQWDKWYPLAGYREHVSPVDWYFLPVHISIVAWMFYVWFLYRNVLARLRESVGNKIFSGFLIVISVFGGSAVAWIPHAWFVGIGFAGCLIGLKFIALGRETREAKTSQDYFVGEGRKFGVLNGFQLAFGLAFAYYVVYGVKSPDMVQAFDIITVFASTLTTTLMLRTWAIHIRRPSMADIFGKFDRGRMRAAGAAI